MTTNDEHVIAQHMSGTNERYTPGIIADRSRELMGRIDLDPATSWLANEVVGATSCYGVDKSGRLHDGFGQKWHGRVFLNPPGGRAPSDNAAKTRSNAALWWWRLANAWKSREIEQAIFVGFTMEILRSAQAVDAPQPMLFPMCIPRKRVCFATPSEVDLNGYPKSGAERVESESPTHANVIIYLPPFSRNGHVSRSNGSARLFSQLFTSIGMCRA